MIRNFEISKEFVITQFVPEGILFREVKPKNKFFSIETFNEGRLISKELLINPETNGNWLQLGDRIEIKIMLRGSEIKL